MQSVIKDSDWYKDVTKGFIDTTPPKPAVPAKKCPYYKTFNSNQ